VGTKTCHNIQKGETTFPFCSHLLLSYSTSRDKFLGIVFKIVKATESFVMSCHVAESGFKVVLFVQLYGVGLLCLSSRHSLLLTYTETFKSVNADYENMLMSGL